MAISKVKALKDYFSTPEKPVTAQELIRFRKDDPGGYDEIAELCAEALGEKLE